MSALYGRNILMLVTHPDDEVVGCAVAARRAQDFGARVYGCYLTHGCIPREETWPWHNGTWAAQVEARHQEALYAANAIGLEPIHFSEVPARRLYRNADALLGQVLDLVTELQIDVVWVPAYEGGNADHDVANAIGSVIADVAGVEVFEYAEYNYAGGRTNWQRFPAERGDEIALDLSPPERAFKRVLLELYRTEAKNLRGVGLARETFRRLGAYDYSAPPHPGLLFFERFRWVPFRHPRLDYTPAAEVRSAIAGLRNGHGDGREPHPTGAPPSQDPARKDGPCESCT